jgi:hypothetical protein
MSLASWIKAKIGDLRCYSWSWVYLRVHLLAVVQTIMTHIVHPDEWHVRVEVWGLATTLRDGCQAASR